VTASLHLFRYAPQDLPRTARGARRHWPALEAAPGLAMARVFALADLDTLTGGTPTPTRWALLCGWEGAGARDAFLADGSALAPLADGARESWSLRLDTVRVTDGSFGGWTPSTEHVERLSRDEPVAVMTYGRLKARYVPAFTRDNRRIVRELVGDRGHTWRLGLFDHPMARSTFSLWRTQGDMVRFSYGPQALHKPVQRRALAAPWAHHWFFARFRPLASTGTWGGVDPLAGLRAPAVA
jgi:hypothetical protein